jgi:Rieske Fe-S protein
MDRRKFTKDVSKLISTGVILSSGQLIAGCSDDNVLPEGTLQLQIAEETALVAGENFLINWVSNGIEKVDLAYKIDQAANYLTFERGLPANSGSYNFEVPNNINGTSLTFRVSDANTGDVLSEGIAIQLLFKWFINLAETKELENVGGYVKVTEVNNPFIIRKTGADSYIALSLICTHQGCVVDVNAEEGGAFACPCHGSTYTNIGEVTKGPAENDLQNFKIEKSGTNDLIIYYS